MRAAGPVSGCGAARFEQQIGQAPRSNRCLYPPSPHLGDQRILAPRQLGQQAWGQLFLFAPAARALVLASSRPGAAPTMLAGWGGIAACYLLILCGGLRLGKGAAGRHIGGRDAQGVGGGGMRRTVGCRGGHAGAACTDPPRPARC